MADATPQHTNGPATTKLHTHSHHQQHYGDFDKIPKKPQGVSHGEFLRTTLKEGGDTPLPFVGVFDAFSAAIAGRYNNAIFLSGFGFSASFYGLPDIGFISWSGLSCPFLLA